MQASIGVRCCKTRQVKDIKGFCDTCKEPFCKRCFENHIGHTIVKLKDFYEERKKDVLDQISTEELSIQLERKREEIPKTRKMLYKSRKDTKEAIKVKEGIIENKEENFKLEIERLDAVNRYLIGLEGEALTVALKDACNNSLKYFNIEDKIRKEFEALDGQLRDAKQRVKRMEKEMGNLKEEFETLNYLRGDDRKYEFDNEKWTVFFLLNEKTHLFNVTIDMFKAFSSVEKVFDIEEVMKKELIDVGEGVKMTEPLKVEKGLITGGSIFASLSHQGILAVCTDKNTLQFTDLNNGRQVNMKVEDKTLAGFYDAMILLLTYDRPQREATVGSVFNNSTVETFKEIEGTDDVWPYTDVTLLHIRRVLYYPTISDRLFSFNVDTRENKEIDVGKRVNYIASFTSIDCDMKVVFQDDDDKYIYILNNDDTITKVDEIQDKYPTTIFPPMSNSKNIKNAVFKYDNVLFKDGNKLYTSNFITFDWYPSVIRIYRDVFLAFDDDAKSWYILRITVP